MRYERATSLVYIFLAEIMHKACIICASLNIGCLNNFNVSGLIRFNSFPSIIITSWLLNSFSQSCPNCQI